MKKVLIIVGIFMILAIGVAFDVAGVTSTILTAILSIAAAILANILFWPSVRE